MYLDHSPKTNESKEKFKELKAVLIKQFGHDPAAYMSDSDVEAVAKLCAELRIEDANRLHNTPF